MADLADHQEGSAEWHAAVMTPTQTRDVITEAELQDWFAEARRLTEKAALPGVFAIAMPSSLHCYPPCPGCGNVVSSQVGGSTPGVWVSWETEVVSFHPCHCRLSIEARQ